VWRTGDFQRHWQSGRESFDSTSRLGKEGTERLLRSTLVIRESLCLAVDSSLGDHELEPPIEQAGS
jgi:hypothetical protein